MRNPAMLFLALAMLAAREARGQVVRYLPSADTAWYQALNAYRMYFIRGGDTLGEVTRDFSVERRTWLPGGRSELVFHDQDLNIGRKLSTDTLRLSPSGRVLAIGGLPPDSTPRGQYDALPRLPEPARALRAGDTWSDTIDIRGAVAAGPIVFAATRRYRVARVFDSLGTRMLEAVAEGRLRYRDAYWSDSAAGRKLWVDVEGPMTSRFVFDVRRGRLVRDGWDMRLVGTAGVDEQSGAVDTIPAGLNSTDDRILVSRERAAMLARPLGGGDTLFSATGRGNILLHVSSRQGDTVTAAMGRADGMLGTVRLVVDDKGSPLRYEAAWTDSTAEVITHRVEVRGDSVIVAGDPASLRPVPTVVWGVADFAMEELLVPRLLQVPFDMTDRDLVIYRPYPRRWQRARVRLREVRSGIVAAVNIEGGEQPVILMFTRGGRLLATANSPRGSERTPAVGTPLRASLDALLAELSGGR